MAEKAIAIDPSDGNTRSNTACPKLDPPGLEE
jgi:hypothetical protein